MRMLQVLALLVLAALPSRAAPSVEDANLATALTGLITVELARSGTLEVASSADLRRVVELEADKAMMGCDTDSCLAELASAMGTRFVVFGELSRVGTQRLLTVTLFDSAQGKSPGRVVRRAPSDDELVNAIPGAVGELVGPTVFALPQREKVKLLVLDIKAPEAAAPVVVAPAVAVAAPPAGPGLMTMGLSGGLVVVGGGLIAGAGAWDYLMPSSNNEAFDVEDLVSVGLIGGGVVLGAVGAAVFFIDPFGD